MLDPLFESKSDFYIEKGIAEAMGLGDVFPADGEEYARALLTTDDPQVAGFTLEKLQEAGGALRPRCRSVGEAHLGRNEVLRPDEAQSAAGFLELLQGEAGDSLDFVCLADIYHSSVTDFVDLVLPSCSKFECADAVGGIKCANAHILANLKVLDPLFESKSDFYIEKGITASPSSRPRAAASTGFSSMWGSLTS